jgi:hypothetical protein
MPALRSGGAREPPNLFGNLVARMTAWCQAEGKDWTLSADSTVVRAHQRAAGPCTRCPRT